MGLMGIRRRSRRRGSRRRRSTARPECRGVFPSCPGNATPRTPRVRPRPPASRATTATRTRVDPPGPAEPPARRPTAGGRYSPSPPDGGRGWARTGGDGSYDPGESRRSPPFVGAGLRTQTHRAARPTFPDRIPRWIPPGWGDGTGWVRPSAGQGPATTSVEAGPRRRPSPVSRSAGVPMEQPHQHRSEGPGGCGAAAASWVRDRGPESTSRRCARAAAVRRRRRRGSRRVPTGSVAGVARSPLARSGAM